VAPFEKIIVFAKAPRLGSVKTRLAASIGGDRALSAYVELLSRSLAAVKSFPHVEIRYAPDDAELLLAPFLERGWTAKPQGEGDLGLRLSRAFQESFDAGAAKVAIIGADCPYLVKKDFQNCWTSLNQNDLVLGPAADGGYWLIGLKQCYPELFRDIPWSSSDVLAQTLARGKGLHLKMDLLRILSDVDNVQDWKEYLASKAEHRAR
jgi:rSAM/selenodomain-associated transferase 1